MSGAPPRVDMAPKGWLDGLQNELSYDLNKLQDTQFEVSVSTHSSHELPPLALAAIALAAFGVFVGLIVLCCRCCCRSERGRVLLAPQPVAPQPQVVTQIITTPYPVSPTPLQMPQPVTHAAGAYCDNNKPSRPADYPPAYDHDQVPLLN